MKNLIDNIIYDWKKNSVKLVNSVFMLNCGIIATKSGIAMHILMILLTFSVVGGYTIGVVLKAQDD